MIKHKNLRDKGRGVTNLGWHEQSCTEALRSMVVYELGYGGQVVYLSPTEVVIDTSILGATEDTTIFEGPKEELELLVKVAAHHVAIMSDEESRTALVKSAVDFLGALPKGAGGVPLYVAMMCPFLVGRPATAAALLFAVGVTDLEVVKAMTPLTLDNLVTAVELSQETGTPIPEIVRELNLAPAH